MLAVGLGLGQAAKVAGINLLGNLTLICPLIRLVS